MRLSSTHSGRAIRPCLQPQVQQPRRCRCWSTGSDASAPAAAATEPEQLLQQQQRELPTPLGSTEPAEEQPKKQSPNAKLSESLGSTSITIIGHDTELIWAVCQALSKKIGWFPVSTAKILRGLHKADSLEEIVEKEGQAALVSAEAGILRCMKDQLRCCVATIGDGAAADASLYSNLYGTVIIWLDEQNKRSPKPATPSRTLYLQQAEVRAMLQKTGGGFGDKEVSLDEKATKAASQLVKAMNQLLKEHSYLPAKKRLYVEMGCRGDWPELKPAEWNPVVDGFQRPSPPVAASSSE